MKNRWLKGLETSPLCRKFVCGIALPLLIALFATSSRGQGAKAPAGEFNLTITGDSNMVTPASPRQNNPKFMAVVNAVRQGDAAFSNLEISFPSDKAYPAGPPRGDNLSADPLMMKELQWIGFNLFQTSNNHALDFGIQGLLDTLQVLKQNGVVHAGTGRTLGEARAPGFLTTPHGRVALVSVASTFAPDSIAGQSRTDSPGRPGLSPLRFETRYRVDTATFESLRKMNQDLKLGAVAGGSGSSRTLIFGLPFGIIYPIPVIFQESDKPGVTTTPNPEDVKAVVREIKEGREFADYVIASSHTHELVPGEEKANAFTPPQFLIEYAHAMIDAGADTFIGNGAHIMRGVEIYKGKPIFYSIGNFITENWIITPQSQTMYDRYGLGLDALSSEAHNTRSDHDRKDEPSMPLFWEGAVARVRFVNGKPIQVIMTPYTLGFGKRAADRGYPEISDVATANKFLENLQKISEPFGTKIVIANGVGTIDIAQ